MRDAGTNYGLFSGLVHMLQKAKEMHASVCVNISFESCISSSQARERIDYLVSNCMYLESVFY